MPGRRKKNDTGNKQRNSKNQRTLFVSGFVSGLDVTVIRNYFSEFGDVGSITVDRYKGKFALVEFLNKPDADRVLQMEHILSGQKLVVKNKYKEDVNINVNPQEEGESISDLKNALFTALKHIKSAQEQLYELPKIISLSDDDKNARNKTCEQLYATIKRFYPTCNIHVYGSSANGYGFKGCDLDILFEPCPDFWAQSQENQHGTRDQPKIPSVYDVTSHRVSSEQLCRMPSECQLKFLQRALQGRPNLCSRALYIPARCPIIKTCFRQYDLHSDISCSNRLVLWNTKLLRCYRAMDSRVLPLMATLRFWAKLHQIIRIGTLSSYAFSLMVIFYLQNTNPPVLPSVEYLRTKSEVSQTEAGWECAFCTDLEKIEPSRNAEPVDYLLREFFNFFINFDFSQFVICPFTGQATDIYYFENSQNSKMQMFKVNAICIQDPFELSRNVSSAQGKALVTLMNALQVGRQTCRPENFKSLNILDLFKMSDFSPIPVKEPAMTFTIVFIGKLRDWLTKALKTANITSVEQCLMKACHAMLDLLNYGYLFETEIVDHKEELPVRKRHLSSENNISKAKCPRMTETDDDCPVIGHNVSDKEQIRLQNLAGNECDKEVKSHETEIKPPQNYHSTVSLNIHEAGCSKSSRSSVQRIPTASNKCTLLMSIQCIAYKKIWQKRKCEKRQKSSAQSSINALELEHSTSLSIAQNVGDIVNGNIKFSCDLYNMSLGGLSQIFVVLTPTSNIKDFKELGGFLKCYVPKTIEEILCI